MSNYRIALILVLCCVLVYLGYTLRESVTYKWWLHTRTRRQANKVLERWAEIRAGEAIPRTKEEKALTIMSEYTYMKTVRDMLWSFGLLEIGDSFWGRYTAESPYGKINVEWTGAGVETEDKVVYNHRVKPQESSPLSMKKMESSL